MKEPLSDKRPLTLAAAFLAQQDPPLATVLRDGGVTRVEPKLLRHWREEFYVFRQYVYRKWIKEELEGQVVRFLNGQRIAKGEETVPLCVTRAVVKDVLHQLACLCQVGVEAMPVWLDGQARPDPRHVVAFTNGLLDVDEWLDDPEVPLAAPTADWFSETVLPRAYDPKAKCGRTIDFFFEALGDREQVDLLQEWMGYILTRDTKYQKMIWLQGLAGGGKGTILRLMRELVGAENTVNFSLYRLAEQFTLSSFLGKTLAIEPDTRLGHDAKTHSIVETLLSIVGEDDLNVDRKFRELISNIKLGTRIAIATNSFPYMPDAGNALRRRSLILTFNETFHGREDVHLGEKLRLELSGLTTWALQGLRRLSERGQFLNTERQQEFLDEMELAHSPVKGFLRDCCEIDPGDGGEPPREMKRALYVAFCWWAQKNGHNRMAVNSLCRQLYETRGVRPVRERDGDSRLQMIQGLRLSAESWEHITEDDMLTASEKEEVRRRKTPTFL